MKSIIATLESYTIANEFLGFRKRKQRDQQRQKEADILYSAINKYDSMLKATFDAYVKQCKAAIHKVWPEVAKSVRLKDVSTHSSTLYNWNRIDENKFHVSFSYGLLYVDFEEVLLICTEEGVDWDDLPASKTQIADKLEKIPIKVPSGLKGVRITPEANPDDYIAISWTVDMNIDVNTAAEESIFNI